MTTTFSRLRILAPIAVVATMLAFSPAAQALNCVQYVQSTAKVSLRGDAHQWWRNAEGVYSRDAKPGAGAVMVFSRTPGLPYGHVAVVRSVKNSRTIEIDHANWSPRNGRRGQVEKAVSVVDVSPRNDWSQVRVWYNPVASLGSRVYPVSGFIHPTSPNRQNHTVAHRR